jgi:hypothetical protein
MPGVSAKRIPLLSRGGVDATSRKCREATSVERTGWCGQEIYRTKPPRLREVGGFSNFFLIAQPPLHG